MPWQYGSLIEAFMNIGEDEHSERSSNIAAFMNISRPASFSSSTRCRADQPQVRGTTEKLINLKKTRAEYFAH